MPLPSQVESPGEQDHVNQGLWAREVPKKAVGRYPKTCICLMEKKKKFKFNLFFKKGPSPFSSEPPNHFLLSPFPDLPSAQPSLISASLPPPQHGSVKRHWDFPSYQIPKQRPQFSVADSAMCQLIQGTQLLHQCAQTNPLSPSNCNF